MCPDHGCRARQHRGNGALPAVRDDPNVATRFRPSSETIVSFLPTPVHFTAPGFSSSHITVRAAIAYTRSRSAHVHGARASRVAPTLRAPNDVVEIVLEIVRVRRVPRERTRGGLEGAVRYGTSRSATRRANGPRSVCVVFDRRTWRRSGRAADRGGSARPLCGASADLQASCRLRSGWRLAGMHRRIERIPRDDFIGVCRGGTGWLS